VQQGTVEQVSPSRIQEVEGFRQRGVGERPRLVDLQPSSGTCELADEVGVPQ
jgi:hypothetical protein